MDEETVKKIFSGDSEEDFYRNPEAEFITWLVQIYICLQHLNRSHKAANSHNSHNQGRSSEFWALWMKIEMRPLSLSWQGRGEKGGGAPLGQALGTQVIFSPRYDAPAHSMYSVPIFSKETIQIGVCYLLKQTKT